MKYDVKFSSGKQGAVGPGSVYLDETGLVVEGDFPRFTVPLLHRLLRQIICTPSVRTIPFSKIVKYVPPRWWRRRHRVIYSLPDRSERTVTFTFRSGHGSGAEFSTHYEEFHAAARSFYRS
jgi:hypothetical protein